MGLSVIYMNITDTDRQRDKERENGKKLVTRVRNDKNRQI